MARWFGKTQNSLVAPQFKIYGPAADEEVVPITAIPQTPLRERAFRAMNQLPPFSPALNRLLATLARENVFFAELAAIIEKDTVLASSVLKLVNSALYARSGTVNSVRSAVSIIGLNKLRNLALSLSVGKLWKQIRMPPSWSHAAFNRHSLATAIMADLLVQRVSVRYPEGGFTAGLLHAMGKMMIATALPRECEEILRLFRESGSLSMEQIEFQVIGCCHAELCAVALGNWKLPPDIQEAVGHQHDPRLRVAKNAGTYLDLSQLLAQAHHVVSAMGLTVPMCTSPVDGMPEDYLHQIGLAADAQQILSDFDSEFGAMQGFF
jgi:HD-like signal output (HDOD) protein